MVQEFITQNYLIVEQNVVTNVCLWDGDTTKWTPPSGSISLIQSTTPALIWMPVIPTTKPPSWTLQEQTGAGAIGFTWDGSVLTTNEPQPQPPVAAENQPIASGVTTI
jgi:hypothetical protein